MTNEKKIYIIKPDWKYNLIPYLISLISLPVFGIGILIFIYYYYQISHIEYAILDDEITISHKGKVQRISLFDIEAVSVSKKWIERQTGLGTLHIETAETTYSLIGIKEPTDIKDAVDIALDLIRRKQIQTPKPRNYTPNIPAGGLDSMNTLVGLWQQGLLSDEDFEVEKKKFTQ